MPKVQRVMPLSSRSWIACGALFHHPPLAGADVGTMDTVTQHEPANGRCSLCGRKSETVTTEELGNWIVQDGGMLLCSGCSRDCDRAVPGQEEFSGAERVEKLPASTAQPRR
jgi:hypothetical protein